MLGFIIWALVGCIMIGIGIFAVFSKKPIGFWANVEMMKVKDVKGYNRAVGVLFIAYGTVFVLLGLPLLNGQNTLLILLSVLGVVIETIAAMIIYSVCITKKYTAEK